MNVKVPESQIVLTSFHWSNLYAAWICTDEMPFKSILYSPSEHLCFSIALLIACLKCLYCCPEPLLAVRKWLSFSWFAHTHLLCAHLDTTCLFYPMIVLRVIMLWRTVALCSMKWNSETGNNQGRTAARDNTIQQQSFVTTNGCAEGLGSPGKVCCRWEPCTVYESCPGFCGSWPPSST